MAKSEEHFVGGSMFGWDPIPSNDLNSWSLNQHFRVNDWLYFGYDKRYFSVLEVNKTSYENCIDAGFIKNVTGGAGRDVLPLTEKKTYYFISGGDYCKQGLKVAINVNDNVAPAPAPTSHKSGAPSALDASNIYHAIVGLILILMFTKFLG
ncbi:lamin-like protein [Trifolium pratense]|uniref:lamin-like protein n=1 Tax=Trifolium pratense TaxID=57577 RepID=UPI001E6972F1|nr:lamin-like protein [Trifolium pratense]